MIYLISGGEPDLADQYSSVVRVVVPGRGTCSGVLVNSQLVITAAHCLCSPASEPLDANQTYAFARAKDEKAPPLQCSQLAWLMATLYGPPDASSRQEDGVKEAFTAQWVTPRDFTYSGPVRIVIHEGYKFRTDDDASILDSEMDLAAIHLSSPIEGVRFDGKMPDREVQADEFVTAVGYGPSENREAGTRRFASARIMNLALSTGADKVFVFGEHEVPLRDVKALSGDSGGPCFRETPSGQRWLVGIISYGREINGVLVTSFTSTFHHRKWISRQLALSAQAAKTP